MTLQSERAELHARLEALGKRIEAKRQEMQRERHLFHERDHLTAEDLRSRYKILHGRVTREVASEEAHSRHVTNLERSVREWLDGIDEDT